MLSLSPAIAAYLIALFLLLGLTLGSFCNAWAFRLCHGQSVAKGRSQCTQCGHTLAPRDLVPLLSYLCLRGRCRYCGGRISPRYPAAEGVSALFFLSVLLRYDLLSPLVTLRWLLLGCLLLVLSLVDLEQRELPDGLLLAAGLFALLRIPTEGLAGVKSGLIGAFSISVPLLLFVLLADRVAGRETMGGGDIKLFFVLGLHFGPALTLLLLILACFLGLLFSAVAGRGKRGASIPFGPPVALAAWLVLLFGAPLLRWYLALF